MDPVSVVGLAAGIQQLLSCIFRFGRGVREAKREINQLCSELFGLKAALEHVSLISQFDGDVDFMGDAQQMLASSSFSTPEFQEMLSFTNDVLTQLLRRLEPKPNRFQSSLQRLAWPLVKDDVKLYVERLERSKQWFILATTSDNLFKKNPKNSGKLAFLLQQAVEKWLAPCDPRPVQKTLLGTFQAGTGNWFLHGVLRDWLDGRCEQFLWLRAKPGVGKTTLLSAAIAQVKHSDRELPSCTHSSFFYCSFNDQQSQDPQNILGSLLLQICEANGELWKELSAIYNTEVGQSSQDPRKLAVNELIDHIVHSSEQLQNVIIVLDALNETKQASSLLHMFVQMTRRTKHLKVLVSSTEELGLQDVAEPVTVVPMRKRDTAGDISYYIDKRLQNDEVFHYIPSDLRSEIKSVLTDKAEGTFRWVQCQLETLSEQGTPREMRNALQIVPSTLERTYRNILARIPGNLVPKAKRALFWITFSLRPLTFAELCEAIIVPEDTGAVHEDMRLLRPEEILRSLSSLISYETATTRLTLAHSSVMQYLTSHEIEKSDVSDFFLLDEETAETDITICCLNYLCSPAFSSGYCPSQKEFAKRKEEWSLLPYIAHSFFTHLSYVTLNDRFITLLLRFFETQKQPRGGNFGAWVQAFFPGSNHNNIESSTPLYYASRFGLLPIVKILLKLEGTTNLETPGGVYGSTPLHVATWQGRTSVVKELLKAGASTKEVNQEGKPALVWAVKFGYKRIENLLRDAGARFEAWMNLEDLEDEEIDFNEDDMIEPEEDGRIVRSMTL